MIVLWEARTGQVIRQIDRPLWGTYLPLAFSPDGRTLASGDADSTILLWDLTGKAGQPQRAFLTEAELSGLWSDLAGDAPKADRALWALAGSVKQAVPFLRKQLRPVAVAAGQEVAKLIDDLDSLSFAVRQQAARKLEELGEAAEGAIIKTLDGNPALEQRQRLEKILQNQDRGVVRRLRAVDALEQIATAEARQVLQDLAKTATHPRVADAAGAAVAGIDRRAR
jgi:hypothetical protein